MSTRYYINENRCGDDNFLGVRYYGGKEIGPSFDWAFHPNDFFTKVKRIFDEKGRSITPVQFVIIELAGVKNQNLLENHGKENERKIPLSF